VKEFNNVPFAPSQTSKPEVMEGRRSFSLGAREIANFWEDLITATGYYREERGIRDGTKRRVNLLFRGGQKKSQ
jgi:hypothetical protein